MIKAERNFDDDRLFRHVAAARINSMESERMALQAIHSALSIQCRTIEARLDMIECCIKAEKASVDQ